MSVLYSEKHESWLLSYSLYVPCEQQSCFLFMFWPWWLHPFHLRHNRYQKLTTQLIFVSVCQFRNNMIVLSFVMTESTHYFIIRTVYRSPSELTYTSWHEHSWNSMFILNGITTWSTSAESSVMHVYRGDCLVVQYLGALSLLGCRSVIFNKSSDRREQSKTVSLRLIIATHFQKEVVVLDLPHFK